MNYSLDVLKGRLATKKEKDTEFEDPMKENMQNEEQKCKNIELGDVRGNGKETKIHII